MGVALVTGASAGIGYELAKFFARDGHSLILVARREDRLKDLAAELQKTSPEINCWIIAADLALPDAGQKLFQRVNQLGLKVDYLVNNAGFGTQGPFGGVALERELKMIDLNVRTLTELTHLFLPQMLERKSGHILNVGSVAGFQPGPYMATYFATKAFINSFTEALHEELLGTGVSATLLAPGYTATEFQEVARMDKAHAPAGFLSVTGKSVAKAGYKAMQRRRAIKVSGGFNTLYLYLLRVSPRSVVRKISGQINKI